MKIKNIIGLLPEKRIIDTVIFSIADDTRMKVSKSFNQAIDQIGEREIGLNREKLAKHIYFIRIESPNLNPKRWEEIGGEYKERYYQLADAIIAKEAEIIQIKQHVEKG